MGFSIKALKSGGGFICRENIGETGTCGDNDLRIYALQVAFYSNKLYPSLEDVSLKFVLFVITEIAMVRVVESVENHKLYIFISYGMHNKTENFRMQRDKF